MDERLWTDRALAPGERIETAGCTVTRREPGVLHLLSGDLRAALDRLAPAAPLLGFAERARSGDHALRIGRDAALLVTAAAVEAAPGWHPDGFALSPAGGAYACLDLSGPGAAEILATGLASPPPWGSSSAALLFCGIRALVSGRDTGLTLWVERGHVTCCCSHLTRCGGHVPGSD